MINVKITFFICCLIVATTAQELLKDEQRENAETKFRVAIARLPSAGGPKLNVIHIGDIYGLKIRGRTEFEFHTTVLDNNDKSTDLTIILYIYPSTKDNDELTIAQQGQSPRIYKVGKLSTPDDK